MPIVACGAKPVKLYGLESAPIIPATRGRTPEVRKRGSRGTCQGSLTVRAVTSTVHGIGARFRIVETSVGVPDKVHSVRNFESRAETPSKRRVDIVNPSVDDSDSDALAKVAFGMELVDTGHDMGGKGIEWVWTPGVERS